MPKTHGNEDVGDGTLPITKINSGAAALGEVPIADGAGAAAWGVPTAGAAAPAWYPPSNTDDSTATGADGMQIEIPAASSTLRFFGENLSASTEVVFFPSSKPTTDASAITTGTGVAFPAVTVAFVAESAGPPYVPSYLSITFGGSVEDGSTYWARGRNGTGAWVPYPASFIGGGAV